MEVFYDGKLIKNNQFLKVSETQIEPEIKLDVNSNKLYTLILYDPDAIGGTYIHFTKINITSNDINTGNIIIPYKGPAPPSGTGIHHYIFNLYLQNEENNNLKEINEKIIPIDKLIDKLNLSNLIYKIQFISKNEIGGKKRKSTKRKIKKNKKYKRTQRR